MGSDQAQLKRLIYHELTHAFVVDLSKGRCPVWLQEGLAQYEENKVLPISTHLFAQSVKLGTLLSKDELILTNVSGYKDQLKAHQYYVQSFFIASYLIGQYGFYRLKLFLEELGNRTQLEEAFEKTFSRAFNSFWDEWRAGAERHYKKK